GAERKSRFCGNTGCGFNPGIEFFGHFIKVLFALYGYLFLQTFRPYGATSQFLIPTSQFLLFI
ncbi:MAG: hypothetical protein K8R79_02490, partial [Calditrichales bacterium]|nr:hypothetical protein [Calditrichales bacterium]